MTPIYLSNRIPWFGNHTGYQQLPRYMQKLAPEMKVIAAQHSFRERMLGKAYSMYRGWSERNQFDAAAELRFLRANSVPMPIKHVLHFEDHFMFFDQWQKAPRDFVATLHIPREQWTKGELRALKHLSSAIVLYQHDMEFYEEQVGKDRVKFILHGVDVDFFRPRPAAPKRNRFLFSGHYLRNTAMFSRVVQRLVKKYHDLEIHLLVPERFHDLDGFAALKEIPQVVWRQNLNDDELCDLICSSWIVLLPMSGSGANTAVVEALSCGTPVITTDVGGIRDYGGGTLFPIVKNDDDDAMFDLVEQYLDRSGWRNQIGAACREFAVKRLAWPVIARQHLETYNTLTN